MMPPHGNFWNEERVEQAKALWLLGYSANTIGKRIGGTRRQIIGKLYRMGLMRMSRPSNPQPYKSVSALSGRRQPLANPTVLRPRLRSDGQPASTTSAPLPVPSDAATRSFAEGGKKTLVDLDASECRWPLGDPQSPDFGYCAHPRHGNAPYCRVHYAVAYRPLNR